MFYVNCGIYAEALARIQSREILTAPKEVDCHFRARIGEIAESVPERFSITPTTDMDDMRKTLQNGLEMVIEFNNTMISARSLVDYYISGPFLHLSEESLHLLLQSNDVGAAKLFLRLYRKSTELKKDGPFLKTNTR